MSDEHQIAALARALAHPARIRILRLLARTPGCIGGEIVEALRLAQSTVSEHLRILKDAGVINGEIIPPALLLFAGPRCADAAGRFHHRQRSAGGRCRLLHACPPCHRTSKMVFDTNRRLVAEALGTCLLVTTVVGSGIMAEQLTGDVALALLGNTLPTGAILVVLITILGPVSGANFNPVVTLVFAMKGALSRRLALAYIAAQTAGGITGAPLAHGMFDLSLLQASSHIRTGPAQWLAEVVATFGLLATILAGVRCRTYAVPWLVGLYITAAYWFTASTSFANPAVAIARAFTDTFSGIRPVDVPAFILAQICGALIAAALFGWLLSPAPAPAPTSEKT